MMETFILITLILVIFYLFIALVLMQAPYPLHKAAQKPFKVAVLIAMRNEENFIFDCLNALAAQNYPSEWYDVFVLDDRSTDRSPMIAKNFCSRYPNFYFKTIKKDLPELRGKMNVLAQGMQKLDHDIIMITDADCVTPEGWISQTVSYFTEQVGMVGNLTVLYPHKNLKISSPETGFFAKIQTLDWVYLQTLGAFNSHIGKPITILGNNFAFRRKAYLQVGGFETLGFSITEDFVLMEAIRKRTSWKIVHTLDAKNSIYSHPSVTINSFFTQRLRWIRGGKSARPWGIFILSLSVIVHLLVLADLLLISKTTLFFILLLLLFGIDLGVIYPILKKLHLRKLLTHFVFFELFYFAYLVVFSILFFVPVKIRWKGRTFD